MIKSVRVKLAETADELDQLFRLRHRVFAEEKAYAPEAREGRLFDRFDALPGVGNIIAVASGEVVGGLRVVEERGAGLPTDAYFDFTPCLPREGVGRTGSIGMLAVEPRYRKRRLFFPLAGMAHSWAARRRLTHLVAALAPGAEQLGLQLGYEALAPRFFHEGLGLWVTPLLLDMARMSGRLAGFVAERHEQYVLHDAELSPPKDQAA